MTRNETRLKDRLYGSGLQAEYSRAGKAAIKETMGKGGKSAGFKADEEAYNDKPVIKWPVPDPTNSS